MSNIFRNINVPTILPFDESYCPGSNKYLCQIYFAIWLPQRFYRCMNHFGLGLINIRLMMFKEGYSIPELSNFRNIISDCGKRLFPCLTDKLKLKTVLRNKIMRLRKRKGIHVRKLRKWKNHCGRYFLNETLAANK